MEAGNEAKFQHNISKIMPVRLQEKWYGGVEFYNSIELTENAHKASK